MRLQFGSFKAAMLFMSFCAIVALQSSQAAPLDASELLRQGKFQELDSEFSAAQRRFERGELTGDEARNAFRAFYPVDSDLAARYDQWVTAFPRSYVARLARAVAVPDSGHLDEVASLIGRLAVAIE